MSKRNNSLTPCFRLAVIYCHKNGSCYAGDAAHDKCPVGQVDKNSSVPVVLNNIIDQSDVKESAQKPSIGQENRRFWF